ncbi:hypothetical protein DFH06DRAFT_1407128 [Mycena polygramma]|nr:hypothetical protein DFH06DRAFT_1407128 [Mycena polygramma]
MSLSGMQWAYRTGTPAWKRADESRLKDCTSSRTRGVSQVRLMQLPTAKKPQFLSVIVPKGPPRRSPRLQALQLAASHVAKKRAALHKPRRRSAPVIKPLSENIGGGTFGTWRPPGSFQRSPVGPLFTVTSAAATAIRQEGAAISPCAVAGGASTVDTVATHASSQSKACQANDWAAHKGFCTRRQAVGTILAEKTGIRDALVEIQKWQEYYHTVLWNCALAAMVPATGETQQTSGAECVFIELQYNGGTDLPVQHRFAVNSVEPYQTSYNGNFHMLKNTGIEEMGPEFYGVGGYTLSVQWSKNHRHMEYRSFTVDRTSAFAAKNPSWREIFRGHIALGRPLKCPCPIKAGKRDAYCRNRRRSRNGSSPQYIITVDGTPTWST